MDADIVLSAEVSESTIKGTFKDLHPYASRLIPKWYANKNDIRKLCFPWSCEENGDASYKDFLVRTGFLFYFIVFIIQ